MDRTPKRWHINSGYRPHSKNNQPHMVQRNLAYLGLGRTDNGEYEHRSNKRGNQTGTQRETFVRHAKVGDTLYLYQNGKGYIYYGRYTGCLSLTEDSELAPDWKDTEVQTHIQVDQWIPITNPKIPEYTPRVTLKEITYQIDIDSV